MSYALHVSVFGAIAVFSVPDHLKLFDPMPKKIVI